MDRTRFEKPPRWWGPKLSPFWVRVSRPFRRWVQVHTQRLIQIEVHGLEHLKQAIDAGDGVLITPNHSGHSDAIVMYYAADLLAKPFYFMTAWQVLGLNNIVRRTLFRLHGCFSVDREGTDLRAFKQAIEILQSKPNPLVIFPEGEVYHLNERVTPFREGPATMALAAAKRAERNIVCIPCGIRYHDLEDPTSELLKVMDQLEQEMFWRPRPELPLQQRVYQLAEGLLALKELEFLGRTCEGSIPDRVANLSNGILNGMEERYGISSTGSTVPERVKACRQRVIKELADLPDDSTQRREYHNDLDDLFLVVQLFSYPGDYVSESASVERLAETLDKFEEDVLGKQTATFRGTRQATITFGEPIPVSADRKKGAGGELTRLLENSVQSLLDQTG
jgi:hypothetical protein